MAPPIFVPVVLLVNTGWFDGQLTRDLLKDQEIEVTEATAARWARLGIARLVTTEDKKTKATKKG